VIHALVGILQMMLSGFLPADEEADEPDVSDPEGTIA
jgi:hypothetical protein